MVHRSPHRTRRSSSAMPEDQRARPRIAPGEIAIGVIIGRTSEFFDFFVYAIASVLVFPSLIFPLSMR
jgi:hypothetical protein